MANLQSTTFNDTGSITMPVGTTAQRPGTPVAGMMRYNTTMELLEWYTGAVWQPVTGFSAGTIGTGGSISFANGGVVHRFTTVGASTFTPAFTGTVQVLVVAGGGAGAGSHGGGGGGGGVILNRAFPVSAGTGYSVTVGGGAASQPYGTFPPNGGNSVFSSITATGGGGGGVWNSNSQRPGGSGGGGGSTDSGPEGNRTRVRGGDGIQGQGFPGGSGVRFNRQGDNAHLSGGGGGAGGPGMSSADDNRDHFTPDGGPGIASDIIGEVLYWAGGGGGGPHYSPGGAGVGGIGGGGGGGAHHGFPLRPANPSFNQGLGGGRALNNGQPAPSQTTGGNAGTNTGGGGGGGNSGSASQQIGAPGIVIIRY